MTEATLTRMRLADGIWEGRLLGRAASPPRLLVRLRDRVVGEPEATPRDGAEGSWLVRFRLPAEHLADGVQTFVIEDAATGEALAHETVIAGQEAGEDVRAEIAVLRAELDLLKRAFRHHCAEDV